MKKMGLAEKNLLKNLLRNLRSHIFASSNSEAIKPAEKQQQVMAYKLISAKVEGRSIKDFVALHGEKTLGMFDTIEEVMDEFNCEIRSHRKAGGEVVLSGDDRAFYINGSNGPYEMLDVRPA